MNNMFKIQCLKGQAVIPYLSELAKLRIEIFKSYPYLYEGDLDYESDYLKTYAQCAESIIVLAFANEDEIVGASTAIPLSFETEEIQAPFIKNHFSIEDVFYLGESVLLPQYRGKGIYLHFFREREAAAKAYGAKMATFCAVERPADHPKQPKDYQPLDKVWQRYGYEKQPELYTYLAWKSVGESALSANKMIFWLKTL